MSDPIKHECGVALLRLRKPLQYYIDTYGSPAYAAKKMYLLMQKQHNRGQDGVGVANIKMDMPPGTRYISRYRTTNQQPIEDIFGKISKKYNKAQKEGKEKFFNAQWMKNNYAFTGEVWMGHLRYGTHGKNNIESCHPFLRQNNWRSRNLVMAGNFNMTNVDELFEKLVTLGQHPKEVVDTVTVMEKIGHFLDEANQAIFDQYRGKKTNQEITEIIENEIDLRRVLEKSCRDFDGGYTMTGMVGYGAAFVARDPNGIRPAYFYADDDVVAVASEKPAIKTTFECNYEDIQEILPGHALIIEKDGSYRQEPYIEQREKKSCSFERIYFSRGTDPDIYNERRKLGELLIPSVLKAVNSDLKNTVFSYIPNTAETSFLGLLRGIDNYLINQRKDIILDQKPSADSLEELLSFRPRVEKLVLKDAKLRTFITDDAHRDDLVAHVYDTTFEVINKKTDTLVVIDDSIVRGTTLEKSILTLLDRLEPKKVVIVSSAPQIRFPDCYGIDMSKMREFVAFRAVLALLEEHNKQYLLDEVYEKCLAASGDKNQPNYVKELYAPFTYDEVSAKITDIVRPKGMKAELEVVYQTVDNLHKACPNHLGDWYFTGDYPTPGGNRVVNKAFINYMKGVEVRAY
ncbi:amidophosphoribosyltransferase [Marinoscillum furvescens]|uniref:Amidophosphoribosyltransferase n=1 Tax=Marinoscillum furvescens DSM 4134 TaxID=1122208 RepID=A0A3D9KY36_MARFU|nr:amidophosphoribosyltransferase [Marinoscillum furvescens]RED91886.1 amidophosphoribosyltransferase [Marinoscillum furvescens DSM 4134]